MNESTRPDENSQIFTASSPEMIAMAQKIRNWSRELGFQQLGICDIELGEHENRLKQWLSDGFHGEMSYMERHGTLRSRPPELHPGTSRVISVRMDYLPQTSSEVETLLQQPE
jgi:epoxyqueuosine reductase